MQTRQRQAQLNNFDGTSLSPRAAVKPLYVHTNSFSHSADSVYTEKNTQKKVEL